MKDRTEVLLFLLIFAGCLFIGWVGGTTWETSKKNYPTVIQTTVDFAVELPTGEYIEIPENSKVFLPGKQFYPNE